MWAKRYTLNVNGVCNYYVYSIIIILNITVLNLFLKSKFCVISINTFYLLINSSICKETKIVMDKRNPFIMGVHIA